ncbi:hypothetical protein ZIOFF_068640 [Zingiber officinale]|uniref:ABC transporter domain-containing protein n=1 Tax=Zingiber officinale TaxID=94328 RepID=A0A8J5C8A2_ZINOF|nr:hypothetical protein ZIOFF_068640 [Zingiber officinale]
MEVIRRVPKIDSGSSNGEALENLSGDMEFRNVEFAYPSRPDNYIFRTSTSMCQQGGLWRWWEAAEDLTILSKYKPISSIELKYSMIGLVSQEPALFAISIKEYILFGKEDATMEEVVAAAMATDAIVSSRYFLRHTTRRAVLKSPKILLLDEATSALDSESERIVQ